MKLPLYSPKLRKPNLRQLPIMVREVRDHSMVPSLPPKTTIWGLKWFMTVEPGDVIIFKHQGREKIKRVHKVKDDELYVLGDFSEESTDSRDYGWIPLNDVLARVVHPKSYQKLNSNDQTSPDK